MLAKLFSLYSINKQTRFNLAIESGHDKNSMKRKKNKSILTIVLKTTKQVFFILFCFLLNSKLNKI